MIVEHFIPGKARELYKRFEKHGRLLPKGVQYIDSWVDEEIEVCYQLMESESRAALDQWVENWKDLAHFRIVPLISSAQAKEKILK